MAKIGNLGAVNPQLKAQLNAKAQQLTIKGKGRPAKQAQIPAAKMKGKPQVKGKEDSLKNRDSLSSLERAIEEFKERSEPMSLDELAAMLRKVNLTFDLFEIQTRYSVNLSTGEVSVQVVNQRTGEVIRKIPPFDVPRIAEALKNGDPLLTDLRI